MSGRFIASLALATALVALPACSGTPDEETTAAGAAAKDPLAGLAIETAKVQEVANVPLGSVPGVITLPPDARVAVTAPFPGAAVRVYVIEGQAVRRGQPLALVRAAQPVQIRGELVRAQSEAGLAQARAERLGQLAKEGVIASARADEAQAALAQARASLAEQNRLAALGGVGPDGTMTLSAPITGRVAHVGVETGGPVDGMEAPFVIEAAGPYQIALQLPERMAKQVRPGMPVEVELANESGGAPLVAAGKVLTVAPSIDPATRSVMARASIDAGPAIVAGRNVSVTIKGLGGQTGVAVPEKAVTRIGGADHVFVRKGSKFEPRKVAVVANSGGQAVISSGLRSGEVVAASSVAELKAMTAE